MVDIDQYEMNKPDLKLDMAIEADIKIFLRTLLNQKNKYINKSTHLKNGLINVSLIK